MVRGMVLGALLSVIVGLSTASVSADERHRGGSGFYRSTSRYVGPGGSYRSSNVQRYRVDPWSGRAVCEPLPSRYRSHRGSVYRVDPFDPRWDSHHRSNFGNPFYGPRGAGFSSGNFRIWYGF